MSTLSQIDSPYRKHSEDRIVQGDILRDVTFIEWELNEENPRQSPVFDKTLPYILILTQDCDLEQDFKNRCDIENSNEDEEKHDKFLQSILVCPAYNAEQFKKGEHLEDFGLKMEAYKDRKRWNDIKGNNNARYHFLEKSSHEYENPDLAKISREYQIPDLVLDFKHYYTIPRNVLYTIYKKHYIASLNELFRESLSQRFSYYLSRIGLPKIAPSDSCEVDK